MFLQPVLCWTAKLPHPICSIRCLPSGEVLSLPPNTAYLAFVPWRGPRYEQVRNVAATLLYEYQTSCADDVTHPGLLMTSHTHTPAAGIVSPGAHSPALLHGIDPALGGSLFGHHLGHDPLQHSCVSQRDVLLHEQGRQVRERESTRDIDRNTAEQ